MLVTNIFLRKGGILKGIYNIEAAEIVNIKGEKQ
jgi:hypothetical protein